MGHRRRRGEADRLADLAHRGRVAAPVDGVADDLEDAALPLGQPVAVRLPGRGRSGPSPSRCPPPCPRTPCRPPDVPLFSATSPPRPPLARRLCSSLDGSASERRRSNTCSKPGRVLSLSSDRAVDIEQSFESNTRSSGEGRSQGRRPGAKRQGGLVMGCVQQAVLEFDEEVQAPWRPPPGRGARRRGARRRCGRCAPIRPGAVPPGSGVCAAAGASCPAGAGASGRPARRRSGPAPRRPAAVRARRGAPAAHAAGSPARGGARPGRRCGARFLAGAAARRRERAPARRWQQRDRAVGRHAVVDRHVVSDGDGDVRGLVDEIQRLNDLDGAALVPGQVLELP